MARTKINLCTLSGACVIEEQVTESFTHRCTLFGGIVSRGDPENYFWYANGSSWYGEPPLGWDKAKAVLEPFTRTYVEQVDYS